MTSSYGDATLLRNNIDADGTVIGTELGGVDVGGSNAVFYGFRNQKVVVAKGPT